MDDAVLNVVINGKDQISGPAKQASGALGGLKSVIKDVFSTALGFNLGQLFVQAEADVKSFATDSIAAYEKQQDAIAQVNAAIKSTHGVAKQTTQDLIDQSEALQKHSTYADEDINSVQALLLTFTSIRGAIYKEATPAILDLATAMHEDLQSATVQVGKALNDPILGITALHRVGVSFSDVQKKQIKNFVDAGQAAKAQKIILAELNKEFGGSAQAAASTYAGRIAILKNEFNNFQEDVGQRILETLDQLSKQFMEVLPQIEKIALTVANELKPHFMALWQTLQTQVLPVLGRLWHEILEPLIPIIAVTLVGALELTVDAFTALLKIVTPVINFMLDNKGAVIAFAGAFVILKAAMMFNDVFNALTIGFNTFKLVTIPSTIASMEALQAVVATPMVFGAIGIGAALVALGLVWDAAQKTKAAVSDAMDARVTAADQGQSIKDIAAKYKAGKISKKQETNAINALLKGVDAAEAQFNHKAAGGLVSGGESYIVNENGQEVFTPSQNGTISPAAAAPAPAAAPAMSFNVQVGMYAGMPSEKRAIAVSLWKEIVREARAHGVNLPQIGSVGIQ